jgi:hypothetical protein
VAGRQGRVERWPIDRLIPYAKNAARQLGIAEIPVMVAAGWTEAQKRALADNQLAITGSGCDPELLRLEGLGLLARRACQPARRDAVSPLRARPVGRRPDTQERAQRGSWRSQGKTGNRGKNGPPPVGGGTPSTLGTAKFETQTPATLLSENLLPIGMPVGMLTVSCNRTAPRSGLLWALHPIRRNANHSTVAGVLQAYRANDLRQAVWKSAVGMASIGGAETFDGIVLSGIVAARLA